MMDPDYIRMKEIKPVLADYISKARVLLKRSAVPDEDAVHDIRVLMKKGRAVLKLTGPFIESELHDKDFQSLRKVGQIMSDWRDTSVHRKILKELKKDLPGIFVRLSANEKIAALIRKPDTITVPDETMKRDIDEIEDLLTKTGYRIRFHQMQKIDPALLLARLELSYETVRNIYLGCRSVTKPEKVHEFRKRAKDLLYQVYFFRPLNPSAVKSFEKRLDRMTVNLGRYNDLYQLLKTLGYVYPYTSGSQSPDELAIKIFDRQDRYLLKVWSDAYKCFRPGLKPADQLGLRLLK